HSKAADEKLYKPGVKNALKEDAGIFYSNAWMRLYRHGITFYRYTFGGGNHWQKWNAASWESNNAAEIEHIRLGNMWKISPLVFLSQITQIDITRAFDILLIALGIFGILLLPNINLKIFL